MIALQVVSLGSNFRHMLIQYVVRSLTGQIAKKKLDCWLKPGYLATSPYRDHIPSPPHAIPTF